MIDFINRLLLRSNGCAMKFSADNRDGGDGLHKLYTTMYTCPRLLLARTHFPHEQKQQQRGRNNNKLDSCSFASLYTTYIDGYTFIDQSDTQFTEFLGAHRALVRF